MSSYKEFADENGFYGRIKDLPYEGKEKGHYTGYITFEGSKQWFEVCGNDGNPFETQEEPQEIIDLTNAKIIRVDFTKCNNIDDVVNAILGD